MKTAAIAKLKAKLSEYIDTVKSGEDVLITDHGRPVARLTSIGSDIDRDARRERLVRKGLIRPGKGPVSLDLIKKLPISRVSREDILRIMDDEREDRV